MNKALQAAQRYTERGLSVIPVVHRGKKPAIGTWKPYQGRRATPDELDRWFGGSTARNLAIVTGYNNLAVIDFDDQHAFVHWAAWCQERGGIAADVAATAYRVQTARGVHVYLQLPHSTRTRPLPEQGIDIKARGGYVLAPPSVHPSGAEYRAPRPAAMIPRVAALSDVLPAALLVDSSPTNGQKAQTPTNGNGAAVASNKTAAAGKSFQDPWAVAAGGLVITASTVERIKQAYRIEDFLPPLEETGRDFGITQCPLHDDHSPSFWVNTGQQVCGCFAGCTRKPLDVINLYARLYDLSNTEAIEILARGLG